MVLAVCVRLGPEVQGLDFSAVQEGWGRIQDGCRECSYRDAG